MPMKSVTVAVLAVLLGGCGGSGGSTATDVATSLNVTAESSATDTDTDNSSPPAQPEETVDVTEPVETAETTEVIETSTPEPAAPSSNGPQAPATSAPDLSVRFTRAPSSGAMLGYATFEFNAADAAGYECSVNDAAFTECRSPLFLEWVAVGDNRLTVRALAEDGSLGEAATHAWLEDNPLTAGHADLIPTNRTPDAVAPNSWRGILRINCDFSHSSYNDPIVHPNAENAAHLHRFYGNVLVDHRTTMESLITSGEASCQGNTLNRSAYWVPALLAPSYDPDSGARLRDSDGEPAWTVVPAVVGNDDVAHEVFYYSAAVDDLHSIQPIPPGLRMIAGDASTRPGQAQDTSVVRWHCQSWESDDASNPRFSHEIPECLAPDRLRMDVFFPSCWNGRDLDAPDHKSHMAYPQREAGTGAMVCPDTHPVPLPRPSYHFAFGVKPEVYDPDTRSSRGWRLASDGYTVSTDTPGGLSLHADWFNGWHPAIMEAMLTGCIQNALDCHDGNLSNGFRLSGTQAGSGAEPAIINRGMGMMEMDF